MLSNLDRDQKIALLLFIGLCAVGGILVGYFTYAARSGADGSLSFSYWLTIGTYSRSAPWAIGGIIAGLSAAFIWKTVRKKE